MRIPVIVAVWKWFPPHFPLSPSSLLVELRQPRTARAHTHRLRRGGITYNMLDLIFRSELLKRVKRTCLFAMQAPVQNADWTGIFWSRLWHIFDSRSNNSIYEKEEKTVGSVKLFLAVVLSGNSKHPSEKSSVFAQYSWRLVLSQTLCS